MEVTFHCKEKQCDFVTKYPVLYSRHCSVFHVSGIKSRFVCGKVSCRRQFSCHSSFLTHLSRDHKTCTQVPIAETSIVCEKFTCQSCSDEYKSVEGIISHLKKHLQSSRDVRVKCPHNGCDKYYSLLSSFTAHLSRAHNSFKTNLLRPHFTEKEAESNQNEVCQNSIANRISEQPSQRCVEIVQTNCVEMELTNSCASITQSVAYFLLTLLSKYHLSEHTIQLILQKFTSISNYTLEAVRANLMSKLSGIVEESTLRQIMQDVFEEKHGILEALSLEKKSPLRSTYSRRKYYEENCKFVKPVAVRLGLNKCNKECHMHYVPILDSLQAFMADESVFLQYVENIKNYNIPSKFELTDIRDGKVLVTHPLFSVDSEALQVILFQDEFLVANPLGSSRKELKMLAVYYTLANLHPWSRANVDAIQLVLLCKSKDFKYFGQRVIFQRLVKELKSLEMNGIDVREKKVKGSVVFIAGDNLGSHCIGGFVENFSSCQYFCRYCCISREDFHNGKLYDAVRTKESYELALHTATANNLISFEGLKMNSLFNDLEYFHVVDHLPPCIGHDVFEGIAQYDVPLILQSFETEGWISCENLNRKIEKFKYKNHDSNNKPCHISFSGRLGGHAAQTWTFIRMLPLLIGKQILDHSNPSWRLFLLLLHICQIISSPRVNFQIIGILLESVTEYVHIRRNIYPDVPLRPKHHYMLHYPRMMVMYGPLSNICTMRFESKHRYFKRCQSASSNTKNVTKTLSIKHQLLQAAHAEVGLFNCTTVISNGSSYNPLFFSSAVNHVIEELQLDRRNISVGTSCMHKGTLYKSNDVLVLTSYLDLNTVIVNMFLQVTGSESELLIIGEQAEAENQESFGVHKLKKSGNIICVSINSLQDHEPYPIYENLGYPVIVLKHLTS